MKIIWDFLSFYIPHAQYTCGVGFIFYAMAPVWKLIYEQQWAFIHPNTTIHDFELRFIVTAFFPRKAVILSSERYNKWSIQSRLKDTLRVGFITITIADNQSVRSKIL